MIVPIRKSALVTVSIPAGTSQTAFPWNNDYDLRGKFITAIEVLNPAQVTKAPDGTPILTSGEGWSNATLTLWTEDNKQIIQNTPLYQFAPDINYGVTKTFANIKINPTKCEIDFPGGNPPTNGAAAEIVLVVYYSDDFEPRLA